jgi:hypothetical protein
MIENLKINWYVEVKKDNSKLTNALNNFNDRYNEILPMIKIQGRLSEQEAQLGYLVSVVHGDWSQLVAIHEHFDILLKKTRSDLYKKYLETYARQLSSNDVKNYIDGDNTVMGFQSIINEIVLVQNKYEGLSKGLESKNFQLNNITKIKSMGLDLVEM